MASAKDIRVAPVSASDARRAVEQWHYSGKCVNNSQLHFGVFLDNALLGAMQFGPPIDKRKLLGLVEGTKWDGMLELNRMAFSDKLPRNSESRALGVAFRMLRKNAPQVKWVVSFADGAQCGDGTIYRASGFVLTAIKRNDQIWEAPQGEKFSRLSLTDGRSKSEQSRAREVVSRVSVTKGKHTSSANGAASMSSYIAAGFKPIPGFQLRYLYFLDHSCKEKLTVPILPFSKIAEAGASMYLGQPR